MPLAWIQFPASQRVSLSPARSDPNAKPVVTRVPPGVGLPQTLLRKESEGQLGEMMGLSTRPECSLSY